MCEWTGDAEATVLKRSSRCNQVSGNEFGKQPQRDSEILAVTSSYNPSTKFPLFLREK